MNSIFKLNQKISPLAFEVRYAKDGQSSQNELSFAKYSLITFPMDDFKVIFNQIGESRKTGFYENHFRLRRSLRAFHQPTMDWVISFIGKKTCLSIEWPNSVRKILPPEEMFEKMVANPPTTNLSKNLPW